jgi:hypothetical protein
MWVGDGPASIALWSDRDASCGLTNPVSPGHHNAGGKISAAQFMAVRQACARHETRLKDGSRAGFFLGDGETARTGGAWGG